jgi:hypothetical protein
VLAVRRVSKRWLLARSVAGDDVLCPSCVCARPLAGCTLSEQGLLNGELSGLELTDEPDRGCTGTVEILSLSVSASCATGWVSDCAGLLVCGDSVVTIGHGSCATIFETSMLQVLTQASHPAQNGLEIGSECSEATGIADHCCADWALIEVRTGDTAGRLYTVAEGKKQLHEDL